MLKKWDRPPTAIASVSDRTANASRNFFSQIGLTAVSLIVALFSVPLLLVWLGEERFGATKVIGDWLGYLLLLEMGFGTSFLALLSRALGRGDEGEGRRLLTTAWKIYLKIALTMFVVGLGLVAAMPSLLRSQHLGADEVRLAGMLSLLGLLLVPFNLGRILLSVRQRDYDTNVLLLLQSLLSTGLIISFARIGLGLPGQMLGLFLGQAPVIFFFGRTLTRQFPGFWRNPSDRRTKEQLWALNLPSFISSLAGRVGFMSDNIVLAFVVGPLAVTPFFLTQRLIVIAQSQLQGVGNASWAGLMELHNKGHKNVFEARTVELTGVVSGLGFAVLAPLAAFNGHFLACWLGPHSYGGDAITVLACVNAWLLAIFSLWGWLIVSGGEIKRWLPYALAFTGINLAASVAGTFLFGLAGPLLGTLISFVAIQSWAMPKVLRKAFGLTKSKLYLAVVQPAIWGLPFATACVWVAKMQTKTPGWFSLIGQLGVAGVTGLALWWCISLGPDARRLWMGRLRSMRGCE